MATDFPYDNINYQGIVSRTYHPLIRLPRPLPGSQLWYPVHPYRLENIALVASEYTGQSPFDIAPSNAQPVVVSSPGTLSTGPSMEQDVQMGNTAEETAVSTSNTEAPVTSASDVPVDYGIAMDATQSAPQSDNAPVTSASIDPSNTGMEVNLPAPSGDDLGGQPLGDHTIIDDLLPFTNAPMLKEEPVDTIKSS